MVFKYYNMYTSVIYCLLQLIWKMSEMTFLCGCGISFRCKNELDQHCLFLDNHRPSVITTTETDSLKRSNADDGFMNRIRKKITKMICMQVQGNGFVQLQSALNSHVQTFFYKNQSDIEGITEFIIDICDEIIELLQNSTSNGLVKFNVVLHATYFHQTTG